MNRIINALKKIDYRMFAALLLFGLIPTLYTTFRIFMIGQLPDSYGFSIAGQMQWVNLLYEILQEALILPLFFFIGAVIANKTELVNRIKTGLIFTFSVYLGLSILIFVFANQLVEFMAQDQSIVTQTVEYIRLETIAMAFSTVVKFLMVVLITLRKDKNVYVILIAQLLMTILLDTFLVSTLDISLNLGVNGIAVTNIFVNLLLLVISLILLRKNDINVFSKDKLSFDWLKKLFVKGGISGLESLVRNLAFMLMIVRMVNVVGEQGTFWVANNFIWGWLLLPVIQLGELIKADTGEQGLKAVKEKSLGYFGITTIIVVLWAITIPLWEPFMKNVIQISNYNDVFYIVLISVGFYVLFAFNNVIDSIFYGLGKTNYMLYQSLIINTLFYGLVFILFQSQVFEPSLVLIALMFAIGTALDSIVTIIMYAIMLKKKKINILKEEVLLRVNLHTHSNISDGKLTPEELVDKLYHDGVNIMALTDHDNLKGLIKAKSRADELGVKFINGIEISTKIIGLGIDFLDPNLHTLHLLGLNFDYFKLLNFYENIDKNKEQKLKVLNEELIKNGYKIPYYNNLTKRLTLAEALVENGYEKNTEDAFNNIINKYYDRWSDNIDVKKAVEIIHQSNGKILWAHPFEILIGTSKYSLNEQQIDIIAGKLKEFGVDGIEVYYQKYNSEQIKFLEQIQKKYNFIASAGTDYHAKDNQPNTYYEIDETFIKGVLK